LVVEEKDWKDERRTGNTRKRERVISMPRLLSSHSHAFGRLKGLCVVWVVNHLVNPCDGVLGAWDG
jgi:hypothetical protein